MNQGQTPDEWLMARVAGGRHDALEALVRRYAKPLLTFITRMVGDRHRGEELFQEVFLAVWTKRGQYNPLYRFKPWLYRIAVNKCRAASRGRRVQFVPLGSIEPVAPARSTNPCGGDTLIAVEDETLVNAAIATLPQRQRSVLVLRVWCRLPYAEIAHILGRSDATVRSNMHHALAALRTYLEPRMQ